MNKDHVKGKVDEVKGTIKEKVGHATHDPDLESEGAVQDAGGKLRGAYGDVKDAAKKTADAVAG
jgi:uncharacterized protein YjbJ (UPF0337 family)